LLRRQLILDPSITGLILRRVAGGAGGASGEN
jgi:hypothetical protein